MCHFRHNELYGPSLRRTDDRRESGKIGRSARQQCIAKGLLEITVRAFDGAVGVWRALHMVTSMAHKFLPSPSIGTIDNTLYVSCSAPSARSDSMLSRVASESGRVLTARGHTQSQKSSQQRKVTLPRHQPPRLAGLATNCSGVRTFGGSVSDKPLNVNFCALAPGATSAV
jgi:hypothetical protein